MWVQGLLFLPAAQAVFPGVKPVLWGWRWGKYGGSAPQGWGGGNSTSNTEAAERQKGCWKVNFLSRIRAEIAGLSCLSEAD